VKLAVQDKSVFFFGGGGEGGGGVVTMKHHAQLQQHFFMTKAVSNSTRDKFRMFNSGLSIKQGQRCMVLGCYRSVNEIFTILGCYMISSA
jgi:hypothetical protein